MAQQTSGTLKRQEAGRGQTQYSVEDELGGKAGNRETSEESRTTIPVRNEGLTNKTVATMEDRGQT